jgi:hypothetical protein
VRIDGERDLRRLTLQVLAERTTTFTLTPNAGSSTLTDARIRYDSPIILVPTTANAAAEWGAGSIYVPETGRVNGSVSITHASNANADRTFRVLIG